VAGLAYGLNPAGRGGRSLAGFTPTSDGRRAAAATEQSDTPSGAARPQHLRQGLLSPSQTEAVERGPTVSGTGGGSSCPMLASPGGRERRQHRRGEVTADAQPQQVLSRRDQKAFGHETVVWHRCSLLLLQDSVSQYFERLAVRGCGGLPGVALGGGCAAWRAEGLF
jgi:hypothetical protein